MTLLSAALRCVRAVQIGGSVDSVALILLGKQLLDPGVRTGSKRIGLLVSAVRPSDFPDLLVLTQPLKPESFFRPERIDAKQKTCCRA